MHPFDASFELPSGEWLAADHEPARSPAATSYAFDATRPGLGVRVRRVGRQFGARHVLTDFDLAIAPGEFVAVVGRSGCGKSTLLRLLAGLDAPDRGAIDFEGQAISRRDDVRIMFQEARLLPWRRVLDNVVLGLREDQQGRGLALLNSVGLSERAKDWPFVLSGGQRQRVALARALAHHPRLLLLDEPLGALDALTRIEMQRLIESLWKRTLPTTVLVTHDVHEAVTLADRIVLIEAGRIALDLRIDLPRPRARTDPEFVRLSEQLLERLLIPD
jgi:sulfonate transport system ATP-binding protein